jgi:carboxymethylenebutenolidase
MTWNAATTDAIGGMGVRTEALQGAGGAQISAYVAQPAGMGPFPGVVLIAHAPGWDEFYREFARRFADHGFIAVAPNIFERYGHGAPDDVAARARGDGGLADATVIGDAEAAMNLIKAQPSSNGKVGIIGTCSGGRHAVLVASSVSGFDAVADLWGGGVVAAPEQLNDKRPVAPISLTQNLNAPIIGLFGNDDMSPSPDQVNQHEAALKEYGKTYQFHRYDGAGHGFFYYQGMSYRPQAAIDGWNKVEDWFKQYLS